MGQSGGSCSGLPDRSLWRFVIGGSDLAGLHLSGGCVHRAVGGIHSRGKEATAQGRGGGRLTLTMVALTALPFPSLLPGWRPLREPWEGRKEARPPQKAVES